MRSSLGFLQIFFIPLWFNSLLCLQNTPSLSLTFSACVLSLAVMITITLKYQAQLQKPFTTLLAILILLFVQSGVPQCLALIPFTGFLPYFFLTPVPYIALLQIWYCSIKSIAYSVMNLEKGLKQIIQTRNKKKFLEIMVTMRAYR